MLAHPDPGSTYRSEVWFRCDESENRRLPESIDLPIPRERRQRSMPRPTNPKAPIAVERTRRGAIDAVRRHQAVDAAR